MSGYRTTCPDCGEGLVVSNFTASCRIPLCYDGFSAVDAKSMDTEEEWVVCGAACGFESSLADLDGADDDTPPQKKRFRVYLDRPLYLTGWVRNVEAASEREAESAIEEKLRKGELTLDDVEWGEPQEEGSWNMLDGEAHEEED